MSFKYLDFYEDHIALGTPKKAEVLVKCIFHDDTGPSLAINLETGLWKCHSLGCETNSEGNGGGDVYKFYMYANKENAITYDMAREQVNEKYNFSKSTKKRETKIVKDFPISKKEIEQKHTMLLSNSKVMDVLTKEFHWTNEVINKFSLGYDGERVWIPITQHDKVVNIRKYTRKPRDGNKVISVAGFGEARLWPLEALDQETVYLFEGEKDCILAHSLELNAMTVTSGAGTFTLEWAKLFDNRNVVVCYDIDEAGRKGADVVARYLMRSAKEVKVVHLPIAKPDNADFTDYIRAGGTKEAFLNIVAKTKPMERVKDSRVPDEVIEMSISTAVEKKLFYRRIKSKIRVVSKMETPSLLPGVLNFTCTRTAGNLCHKCDNHGTGSCTLILDEKSLVTLRLLTSSVKEGKSLYREVFKIPHRCNQYQVVETDHQYVEDILSSPIVEEYNRKNMFKKRFEEHQMYILNTALDVNTDYDIESVMYEHPEDRKIVHLVYRIAPCLSTLENADLTKDALLALKEFQCDENDTEEIR